MALALGGRRIPWLRCWVARVQAARLPPVGATPAAPPAFEPLVVVSEPRALAAMEAGGLDAGTLAFGGKPATSLAQLAGGAGWASIARVLRADIAIFTRRRTSATASA